MDTNGNPRLPIYHKAMVSNDDQELKNGLTKVSLNNLKNHPTIDWILLDPNGDYRYVARLPLR